MSPHFRPQGYITFHQSVNNEQAPEPFLNRYKLALPADKVAESWGTTSGIIPGAGQALGLHGNRRNFDVRSADERSHLDGGARRFRIGHHAFVNVVHLVKVLDVR